MSKEYMLENREEILSRYSTEHRQFQKPALLTKKERKVLGVGKDEGARSPGTSVCPRARRTS